MMSGEEPYNPLHDLPHFSWVGYVPCADSAQPLVTTGEEFTANDLDHDLYDLSDSPDMSEVHNNGKQKHDRSGKVSNSDGSEMENKINEYTASPFWSCLKDPPSPSPALNYVNDELQLSCRAKS